jgi:hypothetical protein
MFFKRQREAKQQELNEVKAPAPEAFQPPAQGPAQEPDQSDDDYRLVLIDQMDEIDKTKREIKGQIHSRNIAARQSRTGVDQAWIRKAKDKIDHLTRERAEIRNDLHTVNERMKGKRKARNGQGTGTMAEEFLKAARRQLDPEVFDSILDDASLKVANKQS